MKVTEIKNRAKELGVKPGKMKKNDLVRAIQTAEGNYACFETAEDYCDQNDCIWRADCLGQ
jgi:hypothetical protein